MSVLPDKARYTFGGDEFLFVEIDEAMSLAANVRAMGIARRLQEKKLAGIIEICPANASLLIRFDPDEIHPDKLLETVQGLEEETKSDSNQVLKSRIIEVPVWYADPYTGAVVERFREGYHQDPSGSDLDYAAKVNGLESAEAFIQRHHESPWLVTMVGFVAGLPFLYQLVEADQQLEVPKYLSPRPSSTPALTVGYGGCFTAIYSVEGAGGYQMLGIGVGPIFDPSETMPDMKDSMVFFRPGDVVKFTPIGESEYRRLQEQVENKTFSYKTVDIDFDTAQALENRKAYNKKLVEVLNGN